MPKRRSTRVYWRRGRAYGDFRDFSDVGGGREALTPSGVAHATTDADVAATLATERVRELEERRRNRTVLGLERPAGLQEFAAHHLVEKAREGNVTEGWLAQSEHHLRRAVDFLGARRELTAVRPKDVREWAAQLGESMSGGTVRHHLNTLSNLFRRAQEDGAVPPGWNPVAALTVKPSAKREEARWLEVHDAALFLEAARVYRPRKPHSTQPHLHEIVATFLLTGGRKSEVLGLTGDDVSFDRGTVTFRPNEHRRLKTRTSHRVVPLFPQLRDVLQEHVFGAGHVSELLFPSGRGTGLVNNLWKSLDAIAATAGWDPGEIRTKVFRHTFCAAALQLLDRGVPISPWTVARWMGHGGQSLVNRVYGHLGDVRHRSEVLEFRVEDHARALGPRLSAFR